jgi:hypothetical protein
MDIRESLQTSYSVVQCFEDWLRRALVAMLKTAL